MKLQKLDIRKSKHIDVIDITNTINALIDSHEELQKRVFEVENRKITNTVTYTVPEYCTCEGGPTRTNLNNHCYICKMPIKPLSKNEEYETMFNIPADPHKTASITVSKKPKNEEIRGKIRAIIGLHEQGCDGKDSMEITDLILELLK